MSRGGSRGAGWALFRAVAISLLIPGLRPLPPGQQLLHEKCHPQDKHQEHECSWKLGVPLKTPVWHGILHSHLPVNGHTKPCGRPGGVAAWKALQVPLRWAGILKLCSFLGGEGEQQYLGIVIYSTACTFNS